MNVEHAGAKRAKVEGEILDANKAKLHADMAALKVGSATIVDMVKPLDPARFQETQYVRRAWCISLPGGVTLDQAFDPRFIRSVAGKMSIGDKVEIRSSDLSEYAEAMVVDSDRNHSHARLSEIFRVKLAGINTDETDHSDYAITHTNDVTTGWQVVRKADGHLMRNGFKTKYDAKYFINADLTPRPLGS